MEWSYTLEQAVQDAERAYREWLDARLVATTEELDGGSLETARQRKISDIYDQAESAGWTAGVLGALRQRLVALAKEHNPNETVKRPTAWTGGGRRSPLRPARS